MKRISLSERTEGSLPEGQSSDIMRNWAIFPKAQLFAILLACCGLFACKKDAAPSPDVIYTVDLDAYTATFTNKTKDAKSFQWDFGDGTSSTEENPVHTYPGKGKFVPTLHVTTTGGVKAEGSTVIHIAKSSAVKLDDNSLSDWDTVTHNVVLPGGDGGIVKKVKFDYNSDNVFFYFELASNDVENIFDFYMDADGNAGTGYTTGSWPGGGFDILLEGAMLNNWLDPLYFSGATQSSWGWSLVSVAEFYQIGTVVQDGGTLKFEGAFKRSKLKGLTGKGLRLAFTVTKSDWSVTLGTMPDEGTAPIFLDMSE